jgi:hypothetical protein
MEEINKKLEETLGELDYLFQEGVYFERKDVDRFDFLIQQFKNIRDDIFFNVND